MLKYGGKKLVIQVDGPSHYTEYSDLNNNQGHYLSSSTRLNTYILEEAGYCVKRIGYKDISRYGSNNLNELLKTCIKETSMSNILEPDIEVSELLLGQDSVYT